MSSIKVEPPAILPTRRWKGWRWLCPLAAVICCGMVGLMVFIDRYGQHDGTRPADAIVILGARVDAVGLPSRSLRERTQHAAQLYERGVAPHIICTGGVGDYPPAEADASADMALALGVPAAAIIREKKSRTTWENIANTLAICKQHGWHSVILVSQPYHMWRALRYCRDQGLTAYPSPARNDTPRVRVFMAAREAVTWVRDRGEGR